MRGVTEDIAILLVGCNADTGGRPMQRTVDAPPSARCADGRSQKSTRRAASSRFIVTRIRGFKKGRRKAARKGTELEFFHGTFESTYAPHGDDMRRYYQSQEANDEPHRIADRRAPRRIQETARIRLLRAAEPLGRRLGALPGRTWLQGAGDDEFRLRLVARPGRRWATARRGAGASARDGRRDRAAGERRFRAWVCH